MREELDAKQVHEFVEYVRQILTERYCSGNLVYPYPRLIEISREFANTRRESNGESM